MKKLLLFVSLICVCFLFCGCNEKKTAGILFNSEPITKDNLLHASRSFESGKRIYYLFYTPKKLKSEFIRIQLGKTGDNIPRGGYKIVWSCDYRVMKQNMYYYYNNLTLYQPGRYVMQVFDIENLSEPLATNFFYVN